MIPEESGSVRVVDVAVVALWREAEAGREVLVTRRPDRGHLRGFWELPGGKVEPGETVPYAAVRELREEIGVRVEPASLELLTTLEHPYPGRVVRLSALLGRIDASASIEHHAVDDHCWTPLAALHRVRFPAANGPITEAIVRRLSREPRLGGR